MSEDNGDAAPEAFGPDASIEARLDTIHQTLATLQARIDALVTSTTTYRSALTDRLTEYADLVSRLARSQTTDLERVTTRIDGLLDQGATGAATDDATEVLTEVREALLDVASGEVVGALWDELREARSAIDTLVARAPQAAAATDGDSGTAEAVSALVADVAALRSELSEGLVVEPSESLAGTVDQLGVDLAAVNGEVRTLRTGVEDIIGRLDEGLVLADELAPPAAAATAPELGDQFAVLRDQVTTEFDNLRQLLTGLADRPDTPPAPETPQEVEVDIDLTPITDLLEQVRTDLAELPSRIEVDLPETTSEAPSTYATVDPDTIDLLREEIRAAGGVSEEVIGAIRNDLVALRRRIKLRAEGEIFTEDQLDFIAESVARKLGE